MHVQVLKYTLNQWTDFHETPQKEFLMHIYNVSFENNPIQDDRHSQETLENTKSVIKSADLTA